jgi:hypothetical protein
MNRLKQSLLGMGLDLLVASSLPSDLWAEGIGFVNQVKIPIVVQGACVENNMVVRRGPQVLIFPGKLGWDINLKPGPRYVTIYDGRQTTRILFQAPVDFRGRDIMFAVRPAPGNLFRVMLVPWIGP